jgi:UDP:flavonoid glycosyltransferase YjiC (YdhE family)
VRSDVLARVAESLRAMDVRVALASGSTPREALGPIPQSWLVRAELPQVTLLDHAVLAVSHGGNNSVTEALTAGVPLLLLPLSTDQFAGAAAVETAGLGEALDPNAATPAQLRAAALRLLSLAPEVADRLASLSARLRGAPGAGRARAALLAETHRS